MSFQCLEIKTQKRCRRMSSFGDDAPDDKSDPLDMIQAHVRLTGQLDEIGPDAFGIRQTIPYAMRKVAKKMNRHVAALHLVARSAERVSHRDRKVFVAPFACNSYNLSQTCRSRSMRNQLQTLLLSEQLAIGARSNAPGFDVFVQ